MARGRKTGGRQPGSLNKTTIARGKALSKAAAAIKTVIPDAFEGDSLALLQLVYRDPSNDMALRLDAAKAALRFERPALAAIEHAGKDGGAINIEIVHYADVIPTDLAQAAAKP